jgi:hypothetical protein
MEQMSKTHPAWGLVSVVMWVVYGQLTGAGHWIDAGMIGLALSTVMVAADYHRGAVKVMNATSVGYFLLEMMIVVFAGRAFMQRYHLPIVWGVFALVAWITLAIGAPFTSQYAREHTPSELWNGPTFHRMNVHLTVVWSLIFTLGAVLGALTMVIGHVGLLGGVIPSFGMLVGLLFGSRYPKRFTAAFEAESHLHTNGTATMPDAARS